MIRLSETKNYTLVKHIVTHPEIYSFVSDDSAPSPEYWNPSESATYCLVTDEDEALGLWAFIKRNAAVWEVHTCILPKARGRQAYEAVKLLPEWAWSHLPGAARIVTEVPAYNQRALIFALKAGMTKYGLNPKSFLKGGELHDVILLGISRGETCH